jgi:nitrate/TMAO reductase-like tetraheme cytochrome c subunit
MNKNVFTVALTCGFLLLITNYVVADKPKALKGSYFKGSIEERSQQCKNKIASILGEECSSCHNEDVTDFTENGKKAKLDIEAATAIGVKCEYCHAGKEQFTDKLDVAVKMFKLSEMMHVECNLCHNGKDVLTSEGRTARSAMLLREWAKTGNKICLECHIRKKQFKLNAKGDQILRNQLEEMLQIQKR